MAHRRITFHRWLSYCLIALSAALLAACTSTAALATEPRMVASQVSPTEPAKLRTPSGITIVTVAPATRPATATPSATSALNQVLLQGYIYAAELGPQQRLNQVTLDWQFFAPDWQQYNGRQAVSDDGLYRLQLPMRASDEVIITARAPGYAPSTAHIHGNQLSANGTLLNFGLVSDHGAAPTLPGDLGTIQLRGSVYNLARGLRSPIAQAVITAVNHSVVQPFTRIGAATNLSGTFDLALELHTTDRIDFTITAAGYLTSTLSKTAKDLAKNPQLTIGLRPAPK